MGILSNRSRPRLPHCEDRGLILLCGLPFAGKSAWAQAQGYPIVSPESIRSALQTTLFKGRWELMVRWSVRFMIYALFLAGHQFVILDDVHHTPEERARFSRGEYQTFVKEIAASVDECVTRAVEAGHASMVPLIRQLASAYEPPDSKEPRVKLWSD